MKRLLLVLTVLIQGLHAAPGNVVLKLGGRNVPPDGDPIDYTTFSLMRLLKRREARVAI